MNEIEASPELDLLLNEFDSRGGVLEFAFYDATPILSVDESHREAAWRFLETCAVANREFLKTLDPSEFPFARMNSYQWDDTKLRGKQISFDEFWGTDEIDPKPISATAWSVPNVDGYKSAFFLPPHGLSGGIPRNGQLFDSINLLLFGNSDRKTTTIWSWSTDCSSYFDVGNEWWGAFLWTVGQPRSHTIAVIGASTTD